ADRNRSHRSTSKTPSYTKSVSWQHHLIEERNNGVIPFNDLPDIKPYPVLLLQDKQRINHLIKAVHAKLCGVQTLYLSTPRSLTVLYRQSYPAWCQSVHNFSIGAAYHR
ncbi:hypothetical protein KX777_24160, partial [Escherichia coli]|uniref:hypothetical protein n=1 Tax=Escherichia coli TaxID=562 RepID=UPI001C527C65